MYLTGELKILQVFPEKLFSERKLIREKDSILPSIPHVRAFRGTPGNSETFPAYYS